MIAIVGNIKVDESKPERIKQLLVCIRSYAFLKDDCSFVLQLNGCSVELMNRVCVEVRSIFSDYNVLRKADRYESQNYGRSYCDLLRFTHHDYIINFMEDQFMVCDDKMQLSELLHTMKNYKVDICKATFFDVEQNSIRSIQDAFSLPIGSVYFNDADFHKQYQQFYGSRYYIGCNFITTKEFAKKFWGRDLGKRPHPYEVARYSKDWEHSVIFPNFEVQAAVDDDHGEPGTCLIKRDCKKWNQIWSQLN